MIEQIIDGIWEDLKSRVTWIGGVNKSATKRSWCIIIRNAIAENQKPKVAVGNKQPTIYKNDKGMGYSELIEIKNGRIYLYQYGPDIGACDHASFDLEIVKNVIAEHDGIRHSPVIDSRKAIAESSCSQAMLEETSAGKR